MSWKDSFPDESAHEKKYSAGVVKIYDPFAKKNFTQSKIFFSFFSEVELKIVILPRFGESRKRKVAFGNRVFHPQEIAEYHLNDIDRKLMAIFSKEENNKTVRRTDKIQNNINLVQSFKPTHRRVVSLKKLV